ncbi:MAG: 2-amino-4-hydroxy-6-hydroxymethyldihydropteridine diphosphokinase [Actinobacteria bacterium HGW-Actinobacteria-6]|nr:MAG: 2-amino-4-hydroxy-6-hydroxymethyldihydropteridine diphosphokinase [Actinobacteria bacterium HGW-Actinobacteria-6]
MSSWEDMPDWVIVAENAGDAIMLSAVAEELTAAGIGVLWDPYDSRLGVTSIFSNPHFKLKVVAAELAAARELLGEESPPGVKLAWAEPGEIVDQPDFADDESWDDVPEAQWDESGVDDPEALAAAEAAVRGPDSPIIPIASGAHEAPKGWRALLGWPMLEEQRHKTLAYIGLGSNLGDRPENLAEALRAIGEIPATEGLAVSRVYESEPWGGVEQPVYANAVAVVATELQADQLLEALQGIEDSLGRVREERYGPRTIDLDLLLFGDEEWVRPDLTIPHPRMLERAFVVVPLLEVDPRVTMPDGSAISAVRAMLGRITGVLGAVPGFTRATVSAGDDDGPQPMEFPEPYVPAVESGPAEDEAAWVTIQTAEQGGLVGYGGSMQLQIHLGVLQSAGIPAVIDPPPIFGSPGMPAYGAAETIRLMVPRENAIAARKALAEARTRE